MRKYFFLLIGSILIFALVSQMHAAQSDTSTYGEWIVEMKSADRGPFADIRWFCNDGTVLLPKPYACKGHEGGFQHGEWSARTKELRQQGYLVANLLAGVDPEKFLSDPAAGNDLAQILIERFLISADDGWILRQALFYRGAIQEEDEREGARELLEAMASRPEWIGSRFTELRVAVRLLPHGKNSASVQKVRQLSASLSDRDAGF
jgi:hypothetical protein